jgi:hypothetical protein
VPGMGPFDKCRCSLFRNASQNGLSLGSERRLKSAAQRDQCSSNQAAGSLGGDFVINSIARDSNRSPREAKPGCSGPGWSGVGRKGRGSEAGRYSQGGFLAGESPPDRMGRPSEGAFVLVVAAFVRRCVGPESV